MDLLAVVSLAVSLLTIGGAFMAVGAEKQKRADLEKRHSELAREARTGMTDERAAREKLADRVSSIDVAVARAETEQKGLAASVGRIEEKLDELVAELRVRRPS